MDDWVKVEIVEDKTGNVELSMGPMPRWRADRVAEGAGINLNWERFHIRVVDTK